MGDKCTAPAGPGRQPIFSAIYGLSSILLCLPGNVMTCIAYGGSTDHPEALNIAGPVMLGLGGFLVTMAIWVAFFKDLICKEPRYASINLRFQKDAHEWCWFTIYHGLPLACVGFTEANLNPIGIGGAVVLMTGSTVLVLGLLLGKCWRPKLSYSDEYVNFVCSGSNYDNVPEETRLRYLYQFMTCQRTAFNQLATAAFIPGIALICVGVLSGPNERIFCQVLGTVYMSFAGQMSIQSIFTIWCGTWGKATEDYDLYHLRMSVLTDFHGRLVLMSIILTPVGFTQDYGLAIGIAGAVAGGLNGVMWLCRVIYTCKVPSPPYPEERKQAAMAAWKMIMAAGVWNTSGYDVTQGGWERGGKQTEPADPPPSYDSTTKNTDTGL